MMMMMMIRRRTISSLSLMPSHLSLWWEQWSSWPPCWQKKEKQPQICRAHSSLLFCRSHINLHQKLCLRYCCHRHRCYLCSNNIMSNFSNKSILEKLVPRVSWCLVRKPHNAELFGHPQIIRAAMAVMVIMAKVVRMMVIWVLPCVTLYKLAPSNWNSAL